MEISFTIPASHKIVTRPLDSPTTDGAGALGNHAVKDGLKGDGIERIRLKISGNYTKKFSQFFNLACQNLIAIPPVWEGPSIV